MRMNEMLLFRADRMDAGEIRNVNFILKERYEVLV